VKKSSARPGPPSSQAPWRDSSSGGLSQAELGRRIGVDRSDIVAAMNQLEAEGQVTRAPDPEDRRRNVVSITPAGRAQLRRLDRAVAAAQDEFTAPLTARERATYLRLVRRLRAHHRSD